MKMRGFFTRHCEGLPEAISYNTIFNYLLKLCMRLLHSVRNDDSCFIILPGYNRLAARQKFSSTAGWLRKFCIPAYVGKSAAVPIAIGIGKRERTAIQRSFCGVNGGWSFALSRAPARSIVYYTIAVFLFRQGKRTKR